MIKGPEIRHDLISGNWVIISPKRGKRPNDFKKNKKKLPCPFEGEISGHNVIIFYDNPKNWRVAVLENKYPAVVHGDGPIVKEKSRTYETLKGFGHHELVVTRSHKNNFPKLSPKDAIEVFEVFRERLRTLKKEKDVSYISIFHNWGAAAGASILHPHYQILAVPIVPRLVGTSLENSERYFKKTGRCMHCRAIDRELREKKRIVFRNKSAIVVAPYVSREPFQLRVYPLKHWPYLEETPESELKDVALALRIALIKLEKKIKKSDYNFFIHSAPVKNAKSFKHYHWHVEILPKLNISAGFELGTGIEINPVDPDDAARILRQ
ncbi:MAG: galactose-1-phosphate uridylyltransferase [Patescibacteria group bacterium]